MTHHCHKTIMSFVRLDMKNISQQLTIFCRKQHQPSDQVVWSVMLEMIFYILFCVFSSQYLNHKWNPASHSRPIIDHNWSVVFPGVREGGHLPAGQTAGGGSAGSGSLLHPALCGHLREGRHEDPQLRDPAAGGQHFLMIGFIFCWARDLSMVVKLRLLLSVQQTFFIFHKKKDNSSLINTFKPKG